MLFAVQDELFTRLHHNGFDDIVPRHGAVWRVSALRDGVRATDLARLSGQLKQVVGCVDDLETLGYVERKPDPADRRAKLIVPTRRGRAQMKTATAIMADITARHAAELGAEEFDRFLTIFRSVVERQRAVTIEPESAP